MRLTFVFSCILATHCYIISSLPTISPVPLKNLETARIVVDLMEDFECPGDGTYTQQESGCVKFFVCHDGKVLLMKLIVTNLINLNIICPLYSSGGSSTATPGSYLTPSWVTVTGMTRWMTTATL